MKILFTHKPFGAYGFISESWMNCCEQMGIEVRRWDGEIDSWRAFDPDVYIGYSGHRQPIPPPGPGRRAKIAVHVNPIPPTGLTSTVDEHPGTVGWVAEQSPDVIFGYAHEHDRRWWAGWRAKVACPFVPMATAGDITLYRPRPALAGTVNATYVGGYWPYKARSIDQFLLPVADRIGLRIHGWGDWPRPVGGVTDEQVPLLLAAAKVGPCISEPHTHAIGIDLPERVFKVVLSGAIAVHDPALNVGLVLPTLPVASTADAYLALCESVLAMTEQARRDLSRQLIGEVLNGHSYHHRLARLLAALGFDAYGRRAKQACVDYARRCWRD
jgi:hypothetical protein